MIPSDRVKSIQHLEGGIVSAVLVKEGQRVTAGQPLVEIDLGGSGLNLEEVSARHAATLATRTRLQAESRGQVLTRKSFDADIDPSVFEGESGAYAARALEQRGVMAGAISAMEQARSRQMEQQAKIAGLQERLALMEKEQEISEQLLAEKLIGKVEVLEKRRQMEAVRSDLAVSRQMAVSAAGAVTGGAVSVPATAQVTVKNTWPDGSAKFALVAGTAPLTAGVAATVALAAGSSTTGTAGFHATKEQEQYQVTYAAPRC